MIQIDAVYVGNRRCAMMGMKFIQNVVLYFLVFWPNEWYDTV